MDKSTKFKVTVITIVGVFFTWIYVNRRWLTDLSSLRNSERLTEEPVGSTVNGKREGKWTIYYTNGELEREEHYKNDTLNGDQFLYYGNGQLHIKRKYWKGRQIDSAIWYHSNGLKNIEEFRDSLGRTQGLFKIYYPGGQPSQIANHKAGMLDGESRTFFVKGQLRAIGHYRSNQKIGKWIEFSENGDTTKVVDY